MLPAEYPVCMWNIWWRDAAAAAAVGMWVHRTPHSRMRLSKSSVNGPDTIVPSRSSSSLGGGDVTGGKKMMIPPRAIDYSCDEEAEGHYYFIYYHYVAVRADRTEGQGWDGGSTTERERERGPD